MFLVFVDTIIPMVNTLPCAIPADDFYACPPHPAHETQSQEILSELGHVVWRVMTRKEGLQVEEHHVILTFCVTATDVNYQQI